MGGAYVYLLRCADGSLYCGWTVDLERRLAAHRAGRGSAYVRGRLPVAYAAAWRCATPSDARRAEALVKRLGRNTKLGLLTGRTPGELAQLLGERQAT